MKGEFEKMFDASQELTEAAYAKTNNDLRDVFFTAPHTHGEHGSHTRIENIDWTDDGGTDFLQFICLDDGVIYKEIEITSEVE